MYAARITRQPGVARRPLTVSRPGDEREKRADQIAEQAMRSSARPAGSPTQSSTQDVRAVMGARFGVDFSHVRIHHDAESERLAHSVGARAFTLGSDIYYGRGERPAVDALTAHELAHVVRPAPPGVAQRTLEVRPPGAGEQSAFDRRQELIDRLNRVSTAVRYRLDMDDRTILYHVTDQEGLSAFDRQMIGCIDGAQLIPLRLVTSAGRIALPGGGSAAVVEDAFVSGYVDLDDLLAADDVGFQMVMAHVITERQQVPRYAQRIGTPGLAPLFPAAHAAGREAEAQILRDIIGDPSIRFSFEEVKPDGVTIVDAFRSGREGYLVFLVLVAGRPVLGRGQVRVETADHRALTLDEFLAERRAAAPPGP